LWWPALPAIQKRNRRGNSRRGWRLLIGHYRRQRIDCLLRERPRGRPHGDQNLSRRDRVGPPGPAAGLPDTPGLKLVERLPPRGIVWSRLLAGLFLADPASGLNRGDNRQVCATTRPV
jgi:hypothetical protein